MGTIQKRTDNSGKVTYQAKIRRVGFPHKSKTFPTKAEAKAWLEQTESVLATPTQDSVQLATKYTFGDLMRRYAKEVSPTKKTGEAEAARLLTICRKPIAKYTVDNLTTQAFAEYRDERLKKVTGSTVNREFNVLHHVLEIARKEWGVNRTAQSVTAPISLLLAADDERPVAVGGTTAPGDQTFRGSERCAPFNRNALPVATEKTECRAAASGDATARSQIGFPRVSTDVIAAFFIDFNY
ncbi:phage integrase [Pandoraea sputorum]|uniref:phage integrase n=1 Tax=Pandoraea sputorum TaxID=93222 RepID=UPI0012416619|nr:hypothetical protein [Pandoraea sputorum]VVE82798.1 integrase [Pandoraea sputorum]